MRAVSACRTLLTCKTELVVWEVYGADKTQCVAILAAYFALRGHHVYYTSRENTTITAMAAFVNRLLPRAADDKTPCGHSAPVGPEARTTRDSDRNRTIWSARLVLATTGLHLAQFRHKHRPLAKAVDYAEIFSCDEAQQEPKVTAALPQETPGQLADWLPAHFLANSRNLHLLRHSASEGKRHYLEGILCQELLRAEQPRRESRTSKQDVRMSGTSSGYTSGSAGGRWRTRAFRHRLTAMSV